MTIYFADVYVFYVGVLENMVIPTGSNLEVFLIIYSRIDRVLLVAALGAQPLKCFSLAQQQLWSEDYRYYVV